MNGKLIMKALFSVFCILATCLGWMKAGDSIYEAGPVEISTETAVTASARIDQLVFGKLKELQIEPANLCSDEVFLRRAYLVTTGTLPREEEARDFLATHDPVKRQLLVEQLLDRPEYADYLSMKWGDLLRIKAEFPIKLWPNAVQAYHHWIQENVRENRPYHEFVRDLLTGSGSNFRQGQVNFYRAMQDRTPQGIASTVALTWMGERTENWPPRKLEALAGFFSHVAYKSTSEWKEEIVYFDPTADKEGLSQKAIFPDGTPVILNPTERDPREVFADWLLRPDNPYFSRTIANRIWSWLMGRGIVEEPDDFGPHNPPCNPELLAFLTDEFNRSRCDVKHLCSIILNSKTFQLSSIAKEAGPEAEANFAVYPLRRMEAEVLIDALNAITGTSEEYSSPIPEPFTFIPEDIRSIALADGSITSPFLELFGRPPRDTGYESERSRNTTAAQRLHMLNSSHIRKKLEHAPLISWSAGVCLEERPEMIERIYLQILSRFPSEDETLIAQEYFSASDEGTRDLALDLMWALVNEPEFYFIH